MTIPRGAHEKASSASDAYEDTNSRRRKALSPRRVSKWGARNAVTAVIAAGGLAPLLVVSISSVSHVEASRSTEHVAKSQLIDSLYSCLESQVRHLVRQGSDVWIPPDEPGVSAGPQLPLIASPLRVVVAVLDTLTPVQTGHINLVLVHSR